MLVAMDVKMRPVPLRMLNTVLLTSHVHVASW